MDTHTKRKLEFKANKIKTELQTINKQLQKQPSEKKRNITFNTVHYKCNSLNFTIITYIFAGYCVSIKRNSEILVACCT